MPDLIQTKHKFSLSRANPGRGFGQFLFAIAISVLVHSGLAVAPAEATQGEPIALRRWPNGSVEIRTHWGLEIVTLGQAVPEIPSNRPNRRYLNFATPLNHVLDRQPNTEDPTWERYKGGPVAANAIRVRSIDQKSSGRQNSDQQNSQSVGITILADGVSFLLLSDSWAKDGSALQSIRLPKIDVIVMPVDLNVPLGGQQVRWIRSLEPRWVVVDSKTDDRLATELADTVGAASEIREVTHNTIAVSAFDEERRETRVIKLSTTTWPMPMELESLFEAMESSNERSRKVFAGLSAEQLNFKPANGTHTPRWNAEHMMGRQLLFFSQIYNAIDPMIPVMDLNPKQMPPQYVAAHPDWDGAEEAEQMERVSEFTRRFAYLLQDVDLDRQAPGSRWTLRALLRQMERHYDQHTANTVKKFELPGWPEE